MTFCKKLKSEKIGRLTVSAYENYEKFSAVPDYIITISEDGIGLAEYKTARTTWRKKYKETADEIKRKSK